MADRTCAREECVQGGKLTRGMCANHYRQWLDHTPPEDRPIAPRFQRNFWDFVVKTHERGCWTWTTPRRQQGYGMWGRTLAHRYSWALANGPIPEGLWVLHHCDNPPCVNPTHLYLGTVVENVQDMVARGRHYVPDLKTHCSQGHALEGENLRIVGVRRVRLCRTCDNDRSAAKQRDLRRARGALSNHLTENDRMLIDQLRSDGASQRNIARVTGRALTTVQRALAASGARSE